MWPKKGDDENSGWAVSEPHGDEQGRRVRWKLGTVSLTQRDLKVKLMFRSRRRRTVVSIDPTNCRKLASFSSHVYMCVVYG